MIAENLENLTALGFNISVEEDLTVTITAVPSTLTNVAVESLLDDVFDATVVSKGLTADIDAIIMRSCKRAVKAGESLPFREARYLIEELIQTGHITCVSPRTTDYYSLNRGDAKEIF